MHWVIQGNLYNETGYRDLVGTLERFAIPYTVVKPMPMTGILLPPDFDSFAHPEGEPYPEIQIDADSIYVCGAYTLCKTAQDRGWVPGAFVNENFDFAVWRQHYTCLNEDAVVAEIGCFDPLWEEFFLRPTDDGKIFGGQLFTVDEFRKWRRDALEFSAIPALQASTTVLAASAKHILREYRCFVVDGRIITASLYKLGSRVVYDRHVDADVLRFAQQQIEKWQPDRAFVIDVALLPENRHAIVEINAINAAGFYACDVQKIVMALEAL